MKLIDLFIKPLAYTHFSLQQESLNLEDFKQQLLVYLNQAQQQAKKDGIADEQIDAGLFAVIAWIDESVMGSNRFDITAWSRFPLQRKFFGMSRAGVDFFVRLNQLDEQDESVREVFLLCLSLGFKGCYADASKRHQLNEIRANLLKQVMGDTTILAADEYIFPELYRQSEIPLPKTGWRPTRFQILFILVPCCLLLLLYFVFDAVLASQVSDFFRVAK